MRDFGWWGCKSAFPLLVAGALSGGCHEGGERPSIDDRIEAGGAGAGGASEGTGGSFGHGGAIPDGTINLPFAVDDHFVPYGFMGSEGALVRDYNECLERPEGAQGNCHRYDYVVPASGDPWAGLYWLSTYDNWGQLPGDLVAAGAKRVVFRAASQPANAPIQFFVGGINEPDLAYSDTFARSVEPELTEELTEWVIDLGAASYPEGVLGAFGFSLASTENYKIYIDDIRWE